MAEVLARHLGQQGIVITSGLARGIDTAAQHGSLATGTVAALAGCVDVVYPQQNQACIANWPNPAALFPTCL